MLTRVILALTTLVLVVGCETSSFPTSPMETGAAADEALSKKGQTGTPVSIGSCDFMQNGSILTLAADCQTESTILVPDGMTLDGAGHTITAVDPDGSHFLGAVVANEGATAHVVNVNVAASDLTSACKAGNDRLRGIMFDGASGSITKSSVLGINKGASGCQEGNGIEVRNEPFDGSHPNTQTVLIAHNTVDAYQKTGIVANGDVDVTVEHNVVGASATQQNLAANGIQLGSGALGSVRHNSVSGNQWLGASNFAATAILIFAADGADVSKNTIGGNADVGIYLFGTQPTCDNNKVFDNGEDGPHGDFGVIDLIGDAQVTNNKVRGYDNPYYGIEEGRNKTIPGPNDPGAHPAAAFAN